jgi:hypothetical protein
MYNGSSAFSVSPVTAVRLLVRIAVLLLLAHIMALLVSTLYPHKLVREIFALFDFSAERNIPTLFSAGLFLLNAVLFLYAGRAGHDAEEDRSAWLTLSLLFLYLGVDEFAGLHERLIGPVRQLLHASGPFYFAWVIPYGIGILALAAGIFPMWRRQERKIRSCFLLSAVTFVSGAIGMEMVGATCFEYLGGLHPEFVNQPLYQTISTVEELLEMSGLIMLVYALLSLLQIRHQGVTLTLADHSDKAMTCSLFRPTAMPTEQ